MQTQSRSRDTHELHMLVEFISLRSDHLNGNLRIAFAFITSSLFANVATAQEDPWNLGPHTVDIIDYGSFSSDLSRQLGFPSEELAKVYYPRDLNNGPYPLILAIHGQYPTCFNPPSASQPGYVTAWPCTEGAPVGNYASFSSIAGTLASHGMIVVSISANGVNAVTPINSSQRLSLFQHHVNLWHLIATGSSSFSPMNVFNGRVDLQRMGAFGHSRGGEAVLDYAATAPQGLGAVLAIAPAGANTVSPVTNIPLAVMLGYCDGDEKDMRGVGFFDQDRYSNPNDTAPKYTVLSLGSNHNYFTGFWTNDEWDRQDYFCGPINGIGRLSASAQQGFSAAYASAFFRRHLSGQKQFDAILRGDAIPPSMHSGVHVGYIPAAKDRLDINRLMVSSELSINTAGGAVGTFFMNANSLCGAGSNCPPWQIAPTFRHPHDTLIGLPLHWSTFGSPPSYSNNIPASKRDFTRFSHLQFRAAVDETSDLNPDGVPQDFSVVLWDGGGRSQSVVVSDYAVGGNPPLYYPPGDWPAAIMNTIRIHIDDFGALDRTNITSVALQFDQTPRGAIILADMALADRRMSVAELIVASDI